MKKLFEASKFRIKDMIGVIVVPALIGLCSHTDSIDQWTNYRNDVLDVLSTYFNGA